MTAPTADAAMERDIQELYDALVAIGTLEHQPGGWAWACANPEAAADSLKLGGRVRAAFLVALSDEGARAPAGFHGGGHAFWRS